MSPSVDWTQAEAAFALLRSGDYERGWAALEAVRFGDTHFRSRKPTLSFPEWRGEPVSSLAVFGEQGLGDQIQFARFIPDLVRRGIEVTLYAYPAVAPLFESLGAKVVAADGEVRIARADAWVMIGSLPLLLGVRLETLNGGAYLSVPPETRRPTLNPDLRVGVMWRGGPNNLNDAHRSMPPAAGRRLLDLPGAVSLAPEDTCAKDMGHTAALIERLDLVISVDTSVAHLAGAMGTRTVLLLPAPPEAVDWRWLVGRRDSPWYDSIEIYRQARPGDWLELIERVTAAVSV